MEFGSYKNQRSQPKHTQMTLGRTKKWIHQKRLKIKQWQSSSNTCAECLDILLKALPISHVVPFRKDTPITLYPLHPAGIHPNYNCVYLVTRFAQYRTQRHHCSSPLYKGTCLASPSRLENKSRASSKMLLILLSVALLAPAQLKTWFLVGIRGRVLRLCLGLGGSHCSEEACK